MAKADVVFTGGRKMYEARCDRHPHCHCFGCGVDVAHFGLAREEKTVVPPELAALPKPVLGYFGVIDERMDYELLAKLADANPSWSVAMIGPTTKVNESELPQRANLHWLGARKYGELPACVRAFDVCLMPFARNESTESINPTKALEYMAAGRLIVSSAVPDVVRNFGSVVKIAQSHAEFVQLCEQCLAAPEKQAIEAGLEMARANSWESIVAQIENHMEAAVQRRSGATPSEAQPEIFRASNGAPHELANGRLSAGLSRRNT
jgi:glycosyltransferase involved in cell wall biosynthesis